MKTKTIKEFLEKIDMYDKYKDELNIDLTKEAYTFEELEIIARVVTDIPIQWVIWGMNHNNICVEDIFEDAIRDGNVAIIKNLILRGYVKSIGKYLYLDIGKNDLYSNHLIDENMYEPMFQLLLKNNETLENFESLSEEYKKAYKTRKAIIENLYNEIKIIKKLKV